MRTPAGWMRAAAIPITGLVNITATAAVACRHRAAETPISCPPIRPNHSATARKPELQALPRSGQEHRDTAATLIGTEME